MLSFVLPIVGLLFTVPELQRLIAARQAAEDCLARARTEQITCEPAPDVLFLVVAGIFGVLFAARLIYVTLRYWRTERP
jgi:hypothetical protein